MLPFVFFAALLLGQSAARTYDFCQGYYTFFGDYTERTPAACLAQCETDNCTEFTAYSYQLSGGIGFADCTSSFRNDLGFINGPYNQPYDGIVDREYVAVGFARTAVSVPARTDLPSTCVVCKSEICFTCLAPMVYSTTGDCIERCPVGQTPNGGGGCVCDVPGCDDCVLPRYYSSESGGCVLPTVVTESPSTTITTATTVTQTLTINQLSTTTPATSTITAVTTSFTGRAACAYNRVTFPAECCPNKFVTGLRRIRLREEQSNLVRRAISFTTTTLPTATSTVSRTVKGRTIARTTIVSFTEAPTPISTFTSVALAQATACTASTRVGLGRCPSDPKPSIDAILAKLKQSGERFVIDCGSAGFFETP